MAKPNTTKKNASAGNGDVSPTKPASQRAADMVAAVAAPLVEGASKLSRLVKKQASGARRTVSNEAPTAPATPENSDGASVAPAKAAKPKAPAKPKLDTAAAVPALDATPAPPPPIPGVTKPASKPKREVKAKAPAPAATPKETSRAGRSTTPKPKKTTFTNDDVALRAYFIAQRRHAEGRHGNPESDWLEAEAELCAEYGRKV